MSLDLGPNDLQKFWAKQLPEAVVYQLKRLDTGHGVTVNDIRKAWKRRNYTIEQIEDTLVTLMEADKISIWTGNDGKRGRPTVRFRYES